jgi:hypothetical protein
MVMSGKEKLYFLLERIVDARDITPADQPLILDPTNNLNRKYRDTELKQLFTKLEKDKQILTVLKTPRRIKELDAIEKLDPYDHADDGCWHIKLLPTFDTYYQETQQEPEYQKFTGKNPPKSKDQNKVLSKPNRNALEKIWDVLQKIEEKRQLGSDGKPIRLHRHPSNVENADKFNSEQKIILEKLQSLGAITKLHKVKVGTLTGWSFELDQNYQKVFREYQNQYEKSAKAYKQSKRMEESRTKDLMYEVTYSEKTREIFINGFLIAKPDFDSENERVFTYLYKHPNQKISLKQLEENTGKLTKTLHKVVENLGFTKDLKRAFFDTAKTSIRFRNPVTKKDLEDIGIHYLKLQ